MSEVKSTANPVNIVFQANIVFLQKVFSQTDNDFANTLGVSFAQLRGMKTGKSEPNLASLLSISYATKMPVDFLLKVELEATFSEKEVLLNAVTDRYNPTKLIEKGKLDPKQELPNEENSQS